MVRQLEFRVFPANLAAGSDVRGPAWFDGSISFSLPAGPDKAVWTERGVAFHIKR